jgi:hypothetical protein
MYPAPLDPTYRQAEMDALARDYRRQSHFTGLMFLLGPLTMGIGFVLFAIAVWQKDVEIKRRVAALGIPYSVWEQEFQIGRYLTVSTYFFAALVLFVGYMGWLLHR